jgi:hypothetical protein
MKRQLLLPVIIILLFSTQFLTGDSLKLLKIEETGEKEKLSFDLRDVEAMVAGFDTGNLTVYIEFADMQDKVLARLGKLKKGKIKWVHKVESKKKMLVKFDKADFPGVLQKIRENPKQPGFQVILSNSKTNEVLTSFEISIAPFPDLILAVTYPIKVKPGEDLKGKISATVKNTGSAPAGNFHVGFSLITEGQPPIELGSVLKNFAKDVIIKDGHEEPKKLNPGESFTMDVTESVKIPQDIAPGRYYFEAKADSGEKIVETNEENNVFKALIIVTVAEPKRLVLGLAKTRLVFKPVNWGFEILHDDTMLSDGKDWRKCRIKSHIYQVRHASWKDFHWEIDTYDRSVWRVTGVDFCKPGGKAKQLKIKVLVRGGSKTALPTSVELSLENTWIEFEPATRKFNLLSYNDQIAYIPFWQTCKLEAHLYQFKHVEWKNAFWEADTFKKKVNRISEGKFCKRGTGATTTPLPITLQVEK